MLRFARLFHQMQVLRSYRANLSTSQTRLRIVLVISEQIEQEQLQELCNLGFDVTMEVDFSDDQINALVYQYITEPSVITIQANKMHIQGFLPKVLLCTESRL